MAQSSNLLVSIGYETINNANLASYFFTPWRGEARNLHGGVATSKEKVIGFTTTAAAFLPVNGVQANRAAGLAFEEVLAAALELAGRQVRRGVVKWTPFGRRVIDIGVILNGRVLGGVECKLGNSRYRLGQRVKDWWLKNHRQYVVNVARKPR